MTLEEELRTKVYGSLKKVSKEYLEKVAREGLNWKDSSSEYLINALSKEDLEDLGRWLLQRGFRLYVGGAEVRAKEFAEKMAGGSLKDSYAEYLGGRSSNVFGQRFYTGTPDKALGGSRLEFKDLVCYCQEGIDRLKPVTIVWNRMYVVWTPCDLDESLLNECLVDVVRDFPMTARGIDSDGSVILNPEVLKEFVKDDMYGSGEDDPVLFKLWLGFGEMALQDVMKFVPNLLDYGRWFKVSNFRLEGSVKEAVEGLSGVGTVRKMYVRGGITTVSTLVSEFRSVVASWFLPAYNIVDDIMKTVKSYCEYGGDVKDVYFVGGNIHGMYYRVNGGGSVTVVLY